MSQVRTDDLVSPDERPAVGMKLGGGYVKLGQELPLKAGERKSELDLLERRGVNEAKRGAIAPLIISANRLSGRTRTHRYLVIMFFAEREVILVTFPEAEDVAAVLMEEVSPSKAEEAQRYSCL